MNHFWESYFRTAGDDNEAGETVVGASSMNEDECSFWSTSLEEDEARIDELPPATNSPGGSTRDKRHDCSTEIERTVLEFRIRMKRAFAEWKRSTEDAIETSS